MKLRWLALAFGLTLASASIVGCGSDDDDKNTGNNPPGAGGGGGNGGENGGGHGDHKLDAGEYRGVFSGGGENGMIEVTVPEGSSAASHHLLADDGSVSLTGTLTPTGGQAIELTGSYDPETGALSLSGGGYTLNGTITEGGFSGDYTGPNGAGKFQATSNANGSVEVFCGSIAGAGNGPMTLIVTGSTAKGYVEPDGKNPVHLSCTIAGSEIDCKIVEVSTVEVIGSASDAGWSGTYENSANGDKGTWTVSSCGG